MVDGTRNLTEPTPIKPEFKPFLINSLIITHESFNNFKQATLIKYFCIYNISTYQLWSPICVYSVFDYILNQTRTSLKNNFVKQLDKLI